MVILDKLNFNTLILNNKVFLMLILFNLIPVFTQITGSEQVKKIVQRTNKSSEQIVLGNFLCSYGLI